jgi:hypothetical protein
MPSIRPSDLQTGASVLPLTDSGSGGYDSELHLLCSGSQRAFAPMCIAGVKRKEDASTAATEKAAAADQILEGKEFQWSYTDEPHMTR